MARSAGGNAFAFYLGVFLVTAATLILQIVETRILSVVSWYHVAFLVVGLAMFGITAGAVRVYTDAKRFSADNLYRELAHNSHALGILTAAALLVQMAVPIVGWREPVANFAAWFVVSVTVALPFYFSGVVVSLALTRSPFPIGRVYAVDLIGASLGCLATLGLLNLVDAPSAILWAGALASAGGLVFARAGATEGRRTSLPSRTVFAALVVLAAFNSLSDGFIRPLFVKGRIEIDADRPVFSEWNSFSRVSVLREEIKPAHLWGPAPTYKGEDWIIAQRRHQIDAVASTSAYLLQGDYSKAGFLEYDVTGLAYHLPRIERVAVIGVGAGRDLVTARLFGASDVTGIEINPILVRLLLSEEGFADYVGLRDDPAVRIVTDEARSWFARAEGSYDLIQMSLIDTWAATGAGAFTLTEHGLYTVEAWRIFLDHLTPDGVLTISRHFWAGNIIETGRMVSLAMATGFALGFEEPRRHIFLAAAGDVASLIVSRSPLAGDRLAALDAAAGRLGHSVLLSPDREPASPVLLKMVSSRSLDELDKVVAGRELDLSPPTDARPFFFNQLRLSTALGMIFGVVDTSLFEHAGGIVSGNLEASKTLLLILMLASVCVVATIVLPLRSALREVDARVAGAGTAYFALIGFGFMLVEIGLLQKFSVFLGHPVYGLSIVLFSIILFTGVGSALSDRLELTPRRFAVWSVVVAAYIAAIALATPPLLLAADSAPLLARALLCVALIAPAGMLMGFGFPTGMRLIAAVDTRPTPWFWGVNGAMGVLGSIVAVIVSMAWGIGVTMTVGALCYLALIPAAGVLRRS
jgi:hypothetical protein